MRSTANIARVGLWAALLVGLAAAAVPLATGDWDPELLRVARPPVQEVAPESKVEVPDVPARFTAHGPAGQPGVTWTLSGERVEAVEPPLVHALVAPRLVVRREGHVVVELTAARGQVWLPRPGEDRREAAPAADDAVRLLLEGGVEVVQGDVLVRTAQVTVWLDRRQRLDPTAGGARLSAPGEVEVRAGASGRRLVAAGLEAVLVPLRVELVGPVEVEDPLGGALPGGATSRPLRGRAARARLEGGRPASGARDLRAAAPARLDVWLDEVDLRAAPPHEDAFRCDLLHLVLVRAPDGARGALGALAGLSSAPELGAGPARYALERATATGRVRARGALDDGGALSLVADEVELTGTSRRLQARGAPARLEDSRGGWLEAPALALVPGGPGRAVELAASGGARFGLPEPTRAAPAATAPPARAWRGAAQDLVGRVRLDAAPGAPAGRAAGLARLERLELEGAPGAPVTLARDDGVTRLTATRVRWDGAGPSASFVVEGEPAAARLGPELTGDAPWRVQARALRASLDRDALLALDAARARGDQRSAEGGPDDDDARLEVEALLSDAQAEGEVELTREGVDSPSRHVALRGECVTWARARRRLDLVGSEASPAMVTVGEGTLRAAALTYDAEGGRVDATGPCVFEVPAEGARDEAGARGVITILAARASGRIDPRPASWREASDARRAARRAGARLVVPGWLHALTLEGDASGRVRATGPRGLAAEADRVTWDAAEGVARLEALPGPGPGAAPGAAPGSPVRVALEGGALEAPRVIVRPSREPGRATIRATLRATIRATIRADGGVRARGRLPGWRDAGDLELACDWLEAEVWEPSREPAAPGARPRLPVGQVQAGGDEGVTIDGSLDAAEGPVPVRMRAARLEGDGVAETLRLHGAPDRPVLLARGELALDAASARLGLEQEGQALRVGVDAPWRCRLPGFDGEAGGTAAGRGPLELLLDAPAAGGPPALATRDPAALARRVLALDAAGGLEVDTPSLRARADRVTLARPGELVLTGDPVEVTRGGLRSRGLEQVLRLEELTR